MSKSFFLCFYFPVSNETSDDICVCVCVCVCYCEWSAVSRKDGGLFISSTSIQFFFPINFLFLSIYLQVFFVVSLSWPRVI